MKDSSPIKQKKKNRKRASVKTVYISLDFLNGTVPNLILSKRSVHLLPAVTRREYFGVRVSDIEFETGL